MRTSMSNRANRSVARQVTCALAVALCTFDATASADSILLGANYLAPSTGKGRHHSFLDIPGLGGVEFITEEFTLLRTEDGDLPALGAVDTVPLELFQLELRGKGSKPRVDLTLNPALPSLGTMTLFHDSADSDIPVGHYSAALELNYIVTG